LRLHRSRSRAQKKRDARRGAAKENPVAKRRKGAVAGNGKPIEPPPNVIIEYIKGQLVRVIHADGAIGGVTPSGNVHIAFFSERPAIPRMMVHKRDPNGTLGQVIPEQTVLRPGVIREMDVDVVLSPGAVDELIKWLEERKSELAKRSEIVEKIKRGKK
jgi:hypothetical protein